MANYLQRIAASGARTLSLAKPPVAGRGLMPPVGPLLRTGIGEYAAEPLEPAVPLTPAGPVAGPPPGGGPQIGSPQEGIRERKSAESAPPPPVNLPQRIATEKPGSRISVRAPEALRASAAPAAREHSIHNVAQETIRTFGPRNLVSRAPSNQKLPPQTKAAPAPPAQPDPDVRQISQQHVPQAEPVRYSPAQEKASIEGSTSAFRPAETGDEAASHVKAAVPRLPTTTSAHANEPTYSVKTKASAEKPVAEIRNSQVLPSSQTQTFRHPGPADSRRRSQISIGRIDVQVNNEAPPQAAEVRPASVPTRMNSLEQRYLGRFFLAL